uniref:Protein phosphatase 1 regulatory subunit 37 n=1 Tax=Timema cristinae TaxID=61476 RepID=A0A7R9CQ47_TIMCR|nr:unnamed protein product [Timema cristinae]
MSEELESVYQCSDAASTLKGLSSCLRNHPENVENVKFRRVSFPKEEHLVTGYLEPANPWEYAENVTRDDLLTMYGASCERHGTCPLPRVLKQLEELDLDAVRCECLNLRGEPLGPLHCECLEEVLKRLQFVSIDLENTGIDDEAATILFDMMEYYESTTRVNISGNKNIGGPGWKACANMIKKMRCLVELDARNVTLNEQYMPIFMRPIRLGTNLEILHLDNCNLTGRPIIMLAAGLKLNSSLRELYLADNSLNSSDAIQLGGLLRCNTYLQLLDISNNGVQDTGVGHILDGLIEQQEPGGLGVLVLWNNQLTRHASTHFARAVSRSSSLEMLNMGQNMLTNECLHVLKDSLQKNKTLLRLGMQSTHLNCEGAVALAEVIADNSIIQRIDLRENNIKIAGLMALCHSMKVNNSVTQLDLDETPKRKMENETVTEQYHCLVTEIRGYCSRNEDLLREQEDTLDETEEDTPTRCNRLSSINTRKISLTCETLLRHTQQLPSTRHLLAAEPRRSGGRLRSPEPSPSPSPIPSPVPSSPRNRFHVSRVSDFGSNTSLSSTSPSMSSSPTRFFSSPSTSRFRVTVVEPSPSPISSTTTSATTSYSTPEISINDEKLSPVDAKLTSVKTMYTSPILNTGTFPSTKVSSSVLSESAVSSSPVPCFDVDVTVKRDAVTNEILIDDRVSLQSQDSSEDTADLEVRQILSSAASEVWINSKAQESDIEFQHETNKSVVFDHGGSSNGPGIKLYQTYPEAVESDKNSSFWLFDELIPHDKKSRSDQKTPSSLDKLLSLFQHPSSFFNKSSASKPVASQVMSSSCVSPLSNSVSLPNYGSSSSASKPPSSLDSKKDLNCVLVGNSKPAACSLVSKVCGSALHCDSPSPDIINNNTYCTNIPDDKTLNFDKKLAWSKDDDLHCVSDFEDENFNVPKSCSGCDGKPNFATEVEVVSNTVFEDFETNDTEKIAAELSDIVNSENDGSLVNCDRDTNVNLCSLSISDPEPVDQSQMMLVAGIDRLGGDILAQKFEGKDPIIRTNHSIGKNYVANIIDSCVHTSCNSMNCNCKMEIDKSNPLSRLKVCEGEMTPIVTKVSTDTIDVPCCTKFSLDKVKLPSLTQTSVSENIPLMVTNVQILSDVHCDNSSRLVLQDEEIDNNVSFLDSSLHTIKEAPTAVFPANLIGSPVPKISGQCGQSRNGLNFSGTAHIDKDPAMCCGNIQGRQCANLPHYTDADCCYPATDSILPATTNTPGRDNKLRDTEAAPTHVHNTRNPRPKNFGRRKRLFDQCPVNSHLL